MRLRRRQPIDDGLAISIASQVAAGLMPGDDRNRRARQALTAIGLMLWNSASASEVREILEQSERLTIERQYDGSTTVRAA